MTTINKLPSRCDSMAVKPCMAQHCYHPAACRVVKIAGWTHMHQVVCCPAVLLLTGRTHLWGPGSCRFLDLEQVTGRHQPSRGKQGPGGHHLVVGIAGQNIRCIEQP